MDDFDHTVLRSAPLAEATLLLLSHATREPFLDDCWVYPHQVSASYADQKVQSNQGGTGAANSPIRQSRP